jgi:hypothetical protein
MDQMCKIDRWKPTVRQFDNLLKYSELKSLLLRFTVSESSNFGTPG